MEGLALTRRRFLGITGLGLGIGVAAWLTESSHHSGSSLSPVQAASLLPGSKAKFAYLSTHGNSACSAAFQASIATLPEDTRLQGSCCSPMNAGRYAAQIAGLKQYSAIAEIPADPYDIQAGLARRLMGYYDLALTPDQQPAYDYAMANSHEKGPCCCQCWRWQVYGGLARYLITQNDFTGEQVTAVWDLSDGCGGTAAS